MNKFRFRFFSVRNISTVAMLSAMSFALYFLKTPLPFFPPFLELQFSEIPVLIAGFILGLPGGISVAIIRFLIKLPLTTTASVGEITDLILALALVIPTILVYSVNKKFKMAILGVLIGIICTTIVAIIINRLFVVDFYVQLYVNGSWNEFLGWFYSLYPEITKESFYRFYLWLAVLPFNALKFGVCAFITVLLYKPLTRVVKFGVKPAPYSMLDGDIFLSAELEKLYQQNLILQAETVENSNLNEPLRQSSVVVKNKQPLEIICHQDEGLEFVFDLELNTQYSNIIDIDNNL